MYDWALKTLLPKNMKAGKLARFKNIPCWNFRFYMLAMHHTQNKIAEVVRIKNNPRLGVKSLCASACDPPEVNVECPKNTTGKEQRACTFFLGKL